MATANPLEDILNSDVDPNAISALVGSLESQLASTTNTDHPQLNSVSTGTRNHVQTQHIGAHVNINAKTDQVALSSLGIKSTIQPCNNPISHSSANGSNSSLAKPQLLTLANNVTATAESVSTSIASPSNKPAMTVAKPVPNANMLLNSDSVQNKHVTVSTSATGGVLLQTTQNGGITTTHSTIAVTNSGIHNLANVAAEQKPLIVNHTVHSTGIPIEQRTLVNAQGKPQFVIKNEPDERATNLVHVTLKSSGANTPATSTIINKPNPQTVTVVRPSNIVHTHHQQQPHQQIQIVNVPNSVNPRLQGVSMAQTKTLAPRMVQAPPVRIAPQQHQQQQQQPQQQAVAGPPRSQGNVVSCFSRCIEHLSLIVICAISTFLSLY